MLYSIVVKKIIVRFLVKFFCFFLPFPGKLEEPKFYATIPSSLTKRLFTRIALINNLFGEWILTLGGLLFLYKIDFPDLITEKTKLAEPCLTPLLN